jgi:DNA-binding helix-hairpin-helix protein with protein kinase domain
VASTIEDYKRELVDNKRVDAAVPLADMLEEAGHPHGPELQELAATIGFSDDIAEVGLAMLIFEELLEAK